MEYESFVGKIRNGGNDNLEITIPLNLCIYAGFKDGDIVKVMIRKQEKEE